MRALHHNFVVIALMIMKFGTCVKLDVFYTMVTKNCDFTTMVGLNFRCSQTPLLILVKFGIQRYSGVFFKYQLSKTLKISL